MDTSKTWLKKHLVALYKSIWLFPVVLTVVLFGLTALKISGSSMGYYHQIFYGTKDPHVILNTSEAIRSDEWLVNTQMTIAQKSDQFKRVNPNIGNGEDMSLLLDVPYKDWSVVFKPHNLAFFVLPFDYAFALKWWLLAYLLILSCYFLVLTILPKRRLLASLAALALFFSPFLQWWYLSGTLNSVTYGLFGATIAIKLLREKRRLQQYLWGALLAYVLTCFAFILYPPYQVPCLLAVAALVTGFAIEELKGREWRAIWHTLGTFAAAGVVAGAFTLTFVVTRSQTIQTIQNTAYPGKRIVLNGDYDYGHLFSSHLAHQFLDLSKAAQYNIPGRGIANQSETSNFILIAPFLLLPGILLLVTHYRKKHQIDWPFLAIHAMFAVLYICLFVPHFNWLSHLLYLNKIPHNRLLIGVGMANLLYVLLFIRSYAKQSLPKAFGVYTYALFVFAVELGLGFYAMIRFPGFVSPNMVWLLSIPVPVVILLLLTKRFSWAMLVLLAFAIYSCGTVNPLYRGTSIYTQTPLSKEIRSLAATDPHGKWATESIFTENFPAINGAPALTGVYSYPQLSVWKQIPGSQVNDYNRYAHVSFAFDRNPDVVQPTKIKLNGSDFFQVISEPCSDFILHNNVHWLLVNAPLSGQDQCAQLVKTVTYPALSFYIYQVKP